jgi:mono/diheme cytochrome c family protein
MQARCAVCHGLTRPIANGYRVPHGRGWKCGQDSVTALHRALSGPAGVFFLALQTRGSAMGAPIQIGHDTGSNVSADVLRSFGEDLKNVADELTAPPAPGDTTH